MFRFVEGADEVSNSKLFEKEYILFNQHFKKWNYLFLFFFFNFICKVHTAKLTIDCPATIGAATTGTLVVDNIPASSRKVTGITDGTVCVEFDLMKVRKISDTEWLQCLNPYQITTPPVITTGKYIFKETWLCFILLFFVAIHFF